MDIGTDGVELSDPLSPSHLGGGQQNKAAEVILGGPADIMDDRFADGGQDHISDWDQDVYVSTLS